MSDVETNDMVDQISAAICQELLNKLTRHSSSINEMTREQGVKLCYEFGNEFYLKYQLMMNKSRQASFLMKYLNDLAITYDMTSQVVLTVAILRHAYSYATKRGKFCVNSKIETFFGKMEVVQTVSDIIDFTAVIYSVVTCFNSLFEFILKTFGWRSNNS